MMDAYTTLETTRQAMNARVQRQLATYWRVRISKAISRLETEARRLLGLEEALAAFAQDYYAAVGDATARLATLESAADTVPTTELDLMSEHRAVREERGREVKRRYRSIAKEIHPDRMMLVEGEGSGAEQMQKLNDAYQQGDLAALLRLEAQLQLTKLCEVDFNATAALESALYDVARAADTYAQGYRDLLNSPLYELMLRAESARMEGWNFTEAVLRRIEGAIEQKEQQLLLARLSSISAAKSPRYAA